LIVDTEIRIGVAGLAYAADISDSEGGEWLLLNHGALSTPDTICVDQGYKASFCEWVATTTPWTVEAVFKPASDRWTVVIRAAG